MRKTVFFLIGAGLAISAAGQTMLDEPAAPSGSQFDDETSGLDIGVGQIRPRGQEINIFTNDAESADRDGASVTNKVKRSTVGFLLSTGIEYSDEGEFEQAERAYLRALEEDEENPEILFRLGGLYVEMERLDDAAQIFKMLVDRYPENPLPRNNLAWCYATGAGIKNTALALRHAREALLFAPTNPSVWNTLAECYYAAGEYDKALRSTDYALELLQRMNPDRDTAEQFWMQRQKILRAQEARDVLEGLNNDN